MAEQNLGEDASSSLSLNQQLDLVSSAQSLDGVKKFADALVRGQLTDTMPLRLADADQYRSYGEPRLVPETNQVAYALGQQINDPPTTKLVEIAVSVSEDDPQAVKICGTQTPESAANFSPNKGLSMDLNYRFVDGLNRKEVKFESGAIYIQTTQGPMGFDALIAIDENGTITDILPPEDYHAERIYGSSIRHAAELAEDKTLPLKAIHHIDQLEASLEEEGFKMKHQRSPDQYKALQTDVAQLLRTTADELFSSQIDHQATFMAIMNNLPKVGPAIHGEGEVSIPPIVFKQ